MTALATVTELRPSWHPTHFTQSLTGTEDFRTDGDRLIALVEKYWRTPDGKRMVLDDWQKWLLRHVLERYPMDWPEKRLRNALRYRQVVISMGRQNGKSVLGAILGLYGLLQHVRGPSVVGVATSVEQAGLIYDRARYVVDNNAPISKRVKATGTRGLRHKDGSGSYMMKASKLEALQGIPITLGLADELHILDPGVWDSIVNGQRAQADALLVGITTAGDDESVLLKRLYAQGHKAIDGANDRFGFFCWEAPEGSTVDTPGAIEAANPSVACGRIDVETVRSDVRDLPEPDQQRFCFNRFVAAVNSWLPMSAWNSCPTAEVSPGPGLVFAVDRTPSWEYATITANLKRGSVVNTEVVASVVKPSLDQLIRVCLELRNRHGHASYAVDGYGLGDLGKALKERGLEVQFYKQGDVIQACSGAYAAIVQGRVAHAGDDLLKVQMPRARRKNVGEAWRISRKDSTVEIDAVMATVIGIHAADTQREPEMQVF